MTVICPKCQHENPDNTAFCGKCGTKFDAGEEIPVQTKTIEAPREELTTGSTFAGRYQIIEELGRGGMGRVYKATDTKINEKVALKLIKPEIASEKKTLERFGNELRIARKITHKNVGRMYDINEEEGTHYITMEYVSGQDLKGLIRQSGQMAIGTSISVAKQACEGLSEAHRIGVIHRDLKPSNIMIDREGNVRIMDFGIARSLKEKGITGAGVMVGTPDYMSPEQAEAKEVDQRSDIYSLGVILYEMVTGRVPFEGDTALSIAMKHKGEVPKDPKQYNAQIPDDLSNLILKCLEKDKESRYQSAGEVSAELENIEKGIPTTDREIPKRKAITSKEITVTFGLRKLLVPALIIVGIAIIGVITWQLLPEKEAEPSEPVKPSIAVLPFEDVSPNKDQEFFCDGLTDELINRLTRVQSLRIPARTSVFSLKGKALDIREIGEKLGVANVLEGSVRKTGNKIRLTVQLVKVADGYPIWSERYERDEKDIFSLQDEISLEIIDKLRIELLGKTQKKVIKRYTDNNEAYDLYMRGLWIFNNKMTEEDWRMAIKHYEKAIVLDPYFSLAYCEIAYVYHMLWGWHFISTDEAVPKIRESLQQALEIDNTLAEAILYSALLKWRYDWDWNGAEDYTKKAIELLPNNPMAHFMYSGLLLNKGQFDEGMKEVKRSVELDPLSPFIRSNYSFGLYLVRRYDDAIEQANKVLESDADYSIAHQMIGLSYIEKSLYEDGISALKQAADLSGNSIEMLLNLAYGYAKSGNSKKSREILKEIDKLSENNYISNYLLSHVYVALGDNEKAFECLELAYENRDADLIHLKLEPAFDDLRSDPRFNELLKKVNLE